MQDSSSGLPVTVSKEERNWAMLAHLSGLLALCTGIGGILGPLIIYFLRKDDMPFAADQAKEALNFQITMFLAGLVAWALVIVLIGFLLLGLIWITVLVLNIVAAVKVSEGVAYRYPINLRLIK